MGGIADAEQPRPIPALEPVDRDLEQTDLVPARKPVDPVRKCGHQLRNFRPQCRKPSAPGLLDRALEDHDATLPIIAMIHQDDGTPRFDASRGPVRIIGFLRQPEPQRVHRRVELLDREPGARANGRMATVASHGEIGPHLDHAVRRIGAHADDPARPVDELSRLGLHPQMKRRIIPTLFGEKIQEVPLRHQCEEFGPGRQIAKVREGIFPTAETLGDDRLLLVRQVQEHIQQAELEHHLHGGGMNGVAAKIAQEIAMLLEDDNVDAGAREQETEHEPARPASNDAATGGECSDCYDLVGTNAP
jgi:hypothetical protein